MMLEREPIRAAIGSALAVLAPLFGGATFLTEAIDLDTLFSVGGTSAVFAAVGEFARRRVYSKETHDREVGKAVAEGRIQIINEHQQSQNRWELDAELAEGP